MLKSGYFASAALYGMNVGGPSSGKSPAQEAAVKPMWEADERLHELYKMLKESFAEAARLKLTGALLEVRLAEAELESDPAKASANLQFVERDARKDGYLLIASKANSLVLARRAKSAQ